MSAFAHPLQFAWHGYEETTGVSPTSETLTALLADVDRHLASAVSTGGAVEQATDEVFAVFEEASERNWDGYGAAPVTPEAVDHALAFAKSMPARLRAPDDVGADPDGDVVLEWWGADDGVLTIAVHQDGSTSYAALLGDDEIHGMSDARGRWPSLVRFVIRNLTR